MERQLDAVCADRRVQQAALANDENTFGHVFDQQYESEVVEHAASHERFTEKFYGNPELRDAITREARQTAYQRIHHNHALHGSTASAATQPAAPAEQVERTPAAAPAEGQGHETAPQQHPTITIDHDATGTLARGTRQEDSKARQALKTNGFRWSRNLQAWYLPRNWKHSTRTVRASRAREALTRLGRDVTLSNHDSPAASATQPKEASPGRLAAAAFPHTPSATEQQSLSTQKPPHLDTRMHSSATHDREHER